MSKLWLPKLWKPPSRIQQYKKMRSRKGSFWFCCCERPPPPEDCLEYEDDFNRADSTNIGNDWGETFGDWSIVSNVLRAPTTELGVAFNVGAFPIMGSMEVETRGTDAGDAARIYYDSESAMEIVFGSGSDGKVRFLHTRNYTDAGINSGVILAECSLDLPVNTWHRMRLCYSDAVWDFPNTTFGLLLFAFYVNDDLIMRGFARSREVSGLKALGTGTGIAGLLRGTVEFDNYAIYKFEASQVGVDVKCEKCGKCCWPFTEDPPEQLVATIHDTSGEAFCFSNPNICSNVNGMQFTVTKTNNPAGNWPLCVTDFYPIICPCAYYEVSGLSIPCDDIVYDTFSVMVGVNPAELGFAYDASCLVLARLWENKARDPPLANHFFESVAFQGWYAQSPFLPHEDLSALCGPFPYMLAIPETPFCGTHGYVELDTP